MKKKTIYGIIISIIIILITVSTVQAATTSTVMNNVNTASNLRIISMTIEDENIKLEPDFDENIHEYTINYEGDLTSIPIKIIPNQQNATEKIIGNEDLTDGENEIKIAVTSKDKKETVEYKITFRKNIVEQEAENIEGNSKYYSEEHVQYGWIIVGVGLGVLTIILIIMSIVGKRNKKRRK